MTFTATPSLISTRSRSSTVVLANFRMGEAFFYREEYPALPTPSRESLQAVPGPSKNGPKSGGHIYLGKVFDLLGAAKRKVVSGKAKQITTALQRFWVKPSVS